MRLEIRPFEPDAERPWVEKLWTAAMPQAWPVLPRGIAALGQGFVAEAPAGRVGFVAVDMAGSIPLILVDRACRRRGIGTSLIEAALDQLRAGGVTDVTAGSGGVSYIWPGVSLDLPDAVGFFAGRGWRRTHETVDLVTDLRGYLAPASVGQRPADAEISTGEATAADVPDVLTFEAATFPQWVRWFEAADARILVARDGQARITGSLLLDGPGATTVFEPLLGRAAGTIGCVGVAPHSQGQGIGTALVVSASQILSRAGTAACHIGWTTRESFYTRAGYLPWRRYAMFSSPA